MNGNFMKYLCSRSRDEQNYMDTVISDSVGSYDSYGIVEAEPPNETTMQVCESSMEQDTEVLANGQKAAGLNESPMRAHESNTELESEVLDNKYRLTRQQLEHRARALNEELEKVRDENESLQTHLKDKDGQLMRLTEQISQLCGENVQKASRISDLEKELKEAKEKREQTRSFFGRLTSNSATTYTRRVPRKQVHYSKQPLEQNVNNVDADIMGKVQERLLTKKNVDVNELPWKQDKSHVPSIVFCVYASRLGTDIEEVLPDLKESPVILVILHSVLKRHASSLASSEHLLSRDIKSKVSTIVHFAFTKQQGLHNCKPNDAALKKLTDVLEQFPGTAL